MRIFIRIALALLTFQTANSQTIRISGFVYDALRGESLPGVTAKQVANSTQTTKEGFFSLNVDVKSQVTFSCVGFDTFRTFVSDVDTILIIQLEESNQLLDEVEVKAVTQQKRIVGLAQLTAKEVKQIPALFGEADVIRAFTFTPGVLQSNEASVGFVVRGGNPSQNLILIDGTTVYNQAHLFGLTSIFNPDVIKSADLYKSYFPAKYGGRASSVLDVTLREGNNKRANKELTIGLINSRFLIEGPFSYDTRDKTTFSLGVRSSYLTFLLYPTRIAFNRGTLDQYFNYWLYDVTAKVKHKFSDRASLHIGFYTGNDFWSTVSGEPTSLSRFNMNWGNLTFSTRYTYLLKPNLFLNAHLSTTNYRHSIIIKEKNAEIETSLNVLSSISDVDFKVDAEWFPTNNHEVDFGVNITYHRFRPSYVKSPFEELTQNNVLFRGYETVAFIESKFDLTPKLRLNTGLRQVCYAVDNVNSVRTEPRASIKAQIFPTFSANLTYSRMNQFVQQVSSNSLGLPVDVWVTSNSNISPQGAEQVSIGINKTLNEGIAELSLEGYYKSFTDLLDFQTGTSILTNVGNSLNDILEKNGIGKSYGLEAFYKKQSDNFSLWVAYTLAYSQRRFETINNGDWHFSNFDRRHALTATTTYNWNDNKRMFSANWIFYTGSPISLPTSVTRQFYEGELSNQTYLIYTDRNNFRMPNYHRLDIAFTFRKQTRRFRDREINVGVYNAYNRANPFYIDIRSFTSTNQVTGGRELIINQGAILPFLPYVSYSIKL